MRRIPLQVCFLLVLCSVARADENGAIHTDTIRSPEGQFALSIDPESKTVSVIRSDERSISSPHLRVRLLAEGGGSRQISLQPVSKPDAPLRYQGSDAAWDGRFRGYVLEFSHDGRSWSELKRAPKSSK